MNISDKYLEISRSLEKHHAIFYMMWELGEPITDESIPTACVRYDPTGEQINFLFNPKFWESIDDYKKSFVIAHECLHVLFNHVPRMVNNKDQIRFNIAADLVVNHTLINNFGFDRKLIKGNNDLCWVDTVFPDKEVFDSETLEYYFNLLKENDYVEKKLIDCHDAHDISAEELQDLCGRIDKDLSSEEFGNLGSLLEEHFESEPGVKPGNLFVTAKVGNVKKKKKWETVIKKWASKYLKEESRELEQWATRNRRFQFVAPDLMLPTEIDIQEYNEDKKKIEVWFFQDTSGSCYGFRDRFFEAALSLPDDKFDVKMHCFDTKVYRTTLESRKLYGFGGTYFSILEHYIQHTIKKENIKYPEAVFVITDGYGDSIYPQHPEKWYWFLRPYNTRCIPKKCNTYNLHDFE